MERGNETSNSYLILLGLFPEIRQLGLLISLVLLIYTVAVVGNVVLVLLIWAEPRLHVPMYILLSQLSLMDAILITTVVPKMAADFFSGRRNVSCVACGAQMFLYLTLGGSECLLLTVMSYDRYVAVCHPLRYPVLVSPRICLRMVGGSWTGGAVNALVQTAYSMHFPICRSREIHHFFCEVMAVLTLSCRDTSAYEAGVTATAVGFFLIPVVLITTSYALIFLSVLRMDSREGRRKALATCSSHLTVVALYFGSAIFIYVTPGLSQAPEQNQALSVFNTILTPALNPLIYSLRNQEVWGALKKFLGTCLISTWNPNSGCQTVLDARRLA
ncbi:olfactory receptor 56-like [Ornithorhynchus anatinus]|uniref:olfactory receptor 56-like n=1 Tax=Ornithorhynchus anatinus TaxID=9258 RepID=UPI0010A7A7DC|nr:olfactory receptor 56-like [Ornithorhynchus anatinus]